MTRPRSVWIPFFLLLTTTIAGCMSDAPTDSRSPYVDLQGSSIRGLSEEEITDLRTGAGMGLARPAELNGWPGPLHALEAANALGLTHEQRTTLEHLRAAMLAEAVPLGEAILAVHARMEERFRDGSIDRVALREDLAELESLQADLRFVHLATHLEAAAVFTPEQRHEYMRLRGYTEDAAHEGHGH